MRMLKRIAPAALLLGLAASLAVVRADDPPKYTVKQIMDMAHKDSKDKSDDREGALRYAVTPGYIEAMRIPLRRGRLFNEGDVAGAPRVVLINESFARRKFPGQDPIGQRVCVRCEAGPDRPWSTIVGVVGDVKQASLELSDVDAVYMPNSQWYWADNVFSRLGNILQPGPEPWFPEIPPKFHLQKRRIACYPRPEKKVSWSRRSMENL